MAAMAANGALCGDARRVTAREGRCMGTRHARRFVGMHSLNEDEPDTDRAPHVIACADFTLLPPEELLRLSAVEVCEPMLYEKGLPRSGGVIDLRMGTADRRFRCGTCKHGIARCARRRRDAARPFTADAGATVTLDTYNFPCRYTTSSSSM